MMWLRRLLTIPVGLVLLLFLIAALVLAEVGRTFLDPDFYPQALREANFYQFALVDASSVAIDEARRLSGDDLPEGLEKNPLVALDLTTEDMVSSINRAIPPEWVQAQVEEAFEQIGRYFVGERDEFALTIQAGERVPAVVSELKSLMRKADAYNLLFDEVIAPAIEDALAEELPSDIHVSSQRIAEGVRSVAPREWVEAQVESALDELTPYIVGDRDTFELRVELADRLGIALDEVRALLRETDAYDLLFNEVVVPTIDNALQGELPLGIEVPGDRLVSAVRTVAPREWVEAQEEIILDQVTPYFVGEEDTFEIRIDLADRVDIALNEIKDLLRETDAYDLLYRQVVEPAVVDNLGPLTQLPFGISVTNEEVVSALRQVAPVEWVQEQAEALIDSVGPYLTGAEDRFSTDISLVNNKRDASEVIEALVIQKLDQAAGGLPECTAAELLDLRSTGNLEILARCAPAGLDLAQTIKEFNLDIAGQIDRFILPFIPDTITFTDENLRQTLELAGAAENVTLIDDIRDIVKDGWTYTSADLRRDLIQAHEEPILKAIDDVRDILANGWTYSDVDLRKNIKDLGGGGFNLNSETLLTALDNTRAFLADGWTYTDADLRGDLGGGVEQLDRVRNALKQAHTFRWVVYLPVALLLLVIGFLGGREWWSRIAWGGGALAICAAAIMILFAPVYGSVAIPRLDDARADALSRIDVAGAFSETQTLVVDKGFEMARSLADGLARDLFDFALTLLIIGLLMAIIPVTWSYYVERRRRLAGR